MTFEKYFSYNPTTQTIDLLKYIKNIPSYFDKKMLKNILQNKIAIPSLSSSVALVAAILSSQVILFATKKIKPIIVPNFLFIDSYLMVLEKRSFN